MKKLFIVFILSFSMLLMIGCVRDLDNSLDSEDGRDEENNMDIEDDLVDREAELIPSGIGETSLYKNEEYHFTLEIPLWWEGIYRVEDGLWMDEVSKSVDFNFESGGISSNIFTIIALDQVIKEEEWEDPFLTYIMEDGERTFVYLPSMEATEELLEEDNKEYLKLVSEMVEEVSGIVETFNSVK